MVSQVPFKKTVTNALIFQFKVFDIYLIDNLFLMLLRQPMLLPYKENNLLTFLYSEQLSEHRVCL